MVFVWLFECDTHVLILATAEVTTPSKALRFQRVLIVVLHVFLTQSVWLVDTIVAERLSIK